MLSMPALRRKTAWNSVILLCALAATTPCFAQVPAPAVPAPAVPVSPAAAPPAAAPPASAPPGPASPAPVPLKALSPTAGGATVPAAPAVPAPDAHKPAATVPPPATDAAHPENRSADKPAAAPSVKPAQKSGPGVNDAGEAATSLRTTKLPLISLIDRSVIGLEKREIGHVIDVLVDVKGQPAALVVDVGGFMGMGNRRIAIAWERFALAGRKPRDALQLPFSDAQVKSAPAYDGSEQVTLVQGTIEPPAAKPVAAPPGKAALGASRVDLGEGLTNRDDDLGDNGTRPGDTQPGGFQPGDTQPADRLNPD